MNFYKGRPILFGIGDPAFEEIAGFRPRGDCRVISTAITLAEAGFLSAAGQVAFISVASTLLPAAIAVGLSYAASALAKKPGVADPGAITPQDGQSVIRQAMPSRKRSYGTVCIGGAVAFEETKDGDLYIDILQGQGEIDSVIAHFLGDTAVAINADGGIIAGAPFTDGDIVQIHNKLGTADQEAPSQLTASFGQVEADYRWRGVPKTLVIYRAVTSDKIGTYYGGGVPAYRAVQRSAMLFDPRNPAHIADGDPDRPRLNGWDFSENGGRVMLDYLRHPDGFKRKAPQVGARSMVPISRFYLPEWIRFINCCDEDVPLKAGGTEKRYRICGSYDMTADPKVILQGMQDACDAELYIRTDGKMGVHGGQWDVPTVEIGNKYILSHQLKPGASKLTAYNVLNVKYTAPDNDFQLLDMDPLRNEGNITLRGEELNKSVNLAWCPSFSQARRIAKIMMAKDNPDWQGTIVVMPYGLKAIGKRTIDFVVPDYGIDRSFLRTSYKPAANLASIAIGVVSLGSSVYGWDPATEEGAAPPVPADTSTDVPVPVPGDFNVIPGSIVVNGGVNASVLAATWTVSIQTFSYEIDWQVLGALATDWNAVRVPARTTSWVSPVLEDATAYNVRFRSITSAGRPSDWSATQVVTTVADATPPGQPTGFGSSKSGSNVTLSWTNPNSANFFKTVIYRNTVNTFGSASVVATLYGGINTARSYGDSALANGTYYWWAQAFNASNLGSTQVGSTTQTIP